jgi:hypothetical protein
MPLTLIFLVLLTLAWVLIFFPDLWRSRRRRPLPAAELFKRDLQSIAPKPGDAGRWVLVPSGERRVRRSGTGRSGNGRSIRRRRRILGSLVWVTGILSGFSLLRPGFDRPAVLAAGALVVYVVLLLGRKRQQREWTAKIKPLPVRSVIGGSASVEARRVAGGAP